MPPTALNLRQCVSLAIVMLIPAILLMSPAGQADSAVTGEQQAWRMASFSLLYKSECAVCHGATLEGSAQGPALVGHPLKGGNSLEAIRNSIAKGSPNRGMPAWAGTLSKSQIHNLALYISEQREGLTYLDFAVNKPLKVNKQTIKSRLYDFKLETVIENLDPLPFSIAPLPGGRILLVEKMRGLSIISKEGEQSPLIIGTPKVFDDTSAPDVGLLYGVGWLMDVALHPDYKKNGWVYLLYGDRCQACNKVSRESGQPVSMNKLIRGRIDKGRWTDQQTLWQAELKFYGPISDSAAGGRLAFDDSGHVFFSVGLKGVDNHTGVQDLSNPWGKIHRINNDGSVPKDNPFIKNPDALSSVWSYGHRNPQGLEFNSTTGELWSTEMGPRGGDEINRIEAGGNYGWPLYSKGVNYDGSPVNYAEKLGIEIDKNQTIQPVVDLTPSPAISSFVIYEGLAFPDWQGHFIVSSLKARNLYRFVIDNKEKQEREVLISKLARIRDIETANDGTLYLLLEHQSGGQIVRIVPKP